MQVGDGDSDHYCWERAEDMTTPREAFKLDQYHPGSDLAGETAAALAASAIAFKPYNSSYSELLLLHAKQVWPLSTFQSCPKVLLCVCASCIKHSICGSCSRSLIDLEACTMIPSSVPSSSILHPVIQ